MIDTLYSLCDFVGKIVETIKVKGDEVLINTADGWEGIIYHSQNCCESVSIHEWTGNLQNMIGQKIVGIVESGDELPPENMDSDRYIESETWTRQIIEFENGEKLNLLWWGKSNGYYSEGVDFRANKI